jgi:hypothetical protein
MYVVTSFVVQLMGWFDAGSDEPIGPTDLFGSLQLPLPSQCFGTADNEYSDAVRSALLDHILDEYKMSGPWPPQAKSTFSPFPSEAPSEWRRLMGSPFLDECLGVGLVVTRLMAQFPRHVITPDDTYKDVDNLQFDVMLPPDSISTTWCQCCDCLKFRRLPWYIDPGTYDDKQFVCSDNYWNLKQASCSVPMDYDPEREVSSVNEKEQSFEEKINSQLMSLPRVTLQDVGAVGSMCDVFCVKNLIWYQARVDEHLPRGGPNSGDAIRVHFLGWGKKYDEIVPVASGRIQALGQYSDPNWRKLSFKSPQSSSPLLLLTPANSVGKGSGKSTSKGKITPSDAITPRNILARASTPEPAHVSSNKKRKTPASSSAMESSLRRPATDRVRESKSQKRRRSSSSVRVSSNSGRSAADIVKPKRKPGRKSKRKVSPANIDDVPGDITNNEYSIEDVKSKLNKKKVKSVDRDLFETSHFRPPMDPVEKIASIKIQSQNPQGQKLTKKSTAIQSVKARLNIFRMVPDISFSSTSMNCARFSTGNPESAYVGAKNDDFSVAIPVLKKMKSSALDEENGTHRNSVDSGANSTTNGSRKGKKLTRKDLVLDLGGTESSFVPEVHTSLEKSPTEEKIDLKSKAIVTADQGVKTTEGLNYDQCVSSVESSIPSREFSKQKELPQLKKSETSATVNEHVADAVAGGVTCTFESRASFVLEKSHSVSDSNERKIRYVII